MKVKVSLKDCIYIICMMFVLNVYYSFFNTRYANQIVELFALFALLYIFKGGKVKKSFLYEFKAFCIPMIVVALCSLISMHFVYHTTNSSDYTQSILRLIMYIMSFCIAYYSVDKFMYRAPLLIIVSGLISYSTVFIRYISAGGIQALFHFMNNKIDGISLEVHNLTYCFGMFFLYYLLSERFSNKYKFRICAILGIAIFFGNKRALYLALGVTLFIYWLFSHFKEKRLSILRVVFALYIIFAFAYLLIIKSGGFAYILAKYGVNDMSRLAFWNYFSMDYNISPSYLGRGISYTDNIMGMKQTQQALRITIATNIHNDILRAYIGWGFFPFLYYLFNFFLLKVQRFIKARNEENGWKYFALASFYFFINFFDNMLTANDFNICFFIIFMLLENEEPGNYEVI